MDSIPSRQKDSVSIGPYVCTNLKCGKSFLRKEHLNRHIVMHTNSRPHNALFVSEALPEGKGKPALTWNSNKPLTLCQRYSESACAAAQCACGRGQADRTGIPNLQAAQN